MILRRGHCKQHGRGQCIAGNGNQQRQLLELTTKFRALVNEAKSVGENTPRVRNCLLKLKD